MNQDKKKFDDNDTSTMGALKILVAMGLFPFTAPFVALNNKIKDKTDKPKSDALSTCCIVVVIAIILLIAVCAA